MRKTILIISIIIIVIIAIVIGVLALKNAQSIIGVWEVSYDEFTLIFEFSDSGVVRISTMDSIGNITGAKTLQYTYNDKTVTIIFNDGSSVSASVSGREMTMDYDSKTITLTKTGNHVYNW